MMMAGDGSSHALPLDAQDNRAVWGTIAHLESKLDSFTDEMRQVLTQLMNQSRDADLALPRVRDSAA